MAHDITITVPDDVQLVVSADGIELKRLGTETPAAEPSHFVSRLTAADEAIAIMCHEANRLYCQSLGDSSQLPWPGAPGWQKASAIEGVRNIRDGLVTRPEESHAQWMAQKQNDGWTYGPVKDALAKTHPCMVPFEQLPIEQQRKDSIFFALASAVLGRRITFAEN